MALLLAPWNDSMQIGMGFNSYTQKICIDGAMTPTPLKKTDDSAHTTDPSPPSSAGPVSQVVSYSSRIVDKLSDIVGAMNVSYGSSIKKGTVEIAGNTSAIDEDKIKESDLNAVVTVRVVNQMSNTNTFTFNSIFGAGAGVDCQKFNETYGDCFISGYIEGGDFTGVVSMKVLDAEKKTQITTSIKSNLTGSTDAKDFTLDSINLAGSNSLSASVKDTETTVSVSWTGGGQIKDPATPWDIDSMYTAAASFPSNVAKTPQRTFAILTKYGANANFIQSPLGRLVEPVNYDGVLSYTADLFENFMEYKQLVKSVQSMLVDPDKFDAQNAKNNTNAISLDIPTLLAVKAALRHEMDKIVQVVDILAKNPRALDKRNPMPMPNNTVTGIINAALGKHSATDPAAKDGKSSSDSSVAMTTPASHVSEPDKSIPGTALVAQVDPPNCIFDELVAPEWFGNNLPKPKSENADSAASGGSDQGPIDFNRFVPQVPKGATQVTSPDSRMVTGKIIGADYGGSDVTSKIKSLYDEWVKSLQNQGRPFQFKVDPKIIGSPASPTQDPAVSSCSVIFSVSIGGQEDKTETFVERQQSTGQFMILDFATAFIYPYTTPPLLPSTEEDVKSQSFRAVDYVMSPPAGDATFDEPKNSFVDFVELDKSSIPGEVTVQTANGAIIGVKTEYFSRTSSASDKRSNGNTSALDGAPNTLTLRRDPNNTQLVKEHIVKVDLWSGTTSKSNGVVVIGAQFMTDQGRVFKVLSENSAHMTQTTFSPPFSGWVLKGFWGAHSTAMNRLGCIWGPLSQG